MDTLFVLHFRLIGDNEYKTINGYKNSEKQELYWWKPFNFCDLKSTMCRTHICRTIWYSM